MDSSTGPDLIIGIDFGMTCTGVSYCNRTRGDNVRWISKWPHRSQANENKVPTIIVYPKGSNDPSSWGFGSESSIERTREEKEYAEWFKTLLDPTILQSRQRKDPQNTPQQEQVDKWYQDYLHLLYQHIEARLGSELPSNKPWHIAHVEFNFSIPTTWQPYPTVEKFRSIAERAGYGSHPNHVVEMSLTEPEAAAVHTSVDAPGIFQENESLIICDAGGGTTDLSIMRITGIYSGTVALQQLDTVVGRTIGSVQIDKDFEDFVLQRLQQANSTFNLGLDPDEAAWVMMKSREYQNAKCDFGSPDDTTYFFVPVPGLNPQFSSDQFGMASGAMRFHTKSVLERMFNTQIQKLTALVDKHLNEFQTAHPGEQISHFILSGGLGNSVYVQEQLKAKYAFGMSTLACARNIQIHVAPDPQLAVCKGIVTDRVRKLQSGRAVLGWRCARASYGTVCKILYDRNNPEHMGRQTYQDPLNGKYYINQGIVWFIKRGEAVNVDMPIVHQFRRKILPGDPSRAFPTNVVVSHLDKNLLPLQVNRDAEILCEVKSDLSGIDARKFKLKNRHWWSLRKPYYRVDYQIRVVIGPADIRFELWFDGQKMNKDNPIKVEWQATSAPEPEPQEDSVYLNGKPAQSTFSIPRRGIGPTGFHNQFGQNFYPSGWGSQQQAGGYNPGLAYNMNGRL